MPNCAPAIRRNGRLTDMLPVRPGILTFIRAVPTAITSSVQNL